MAGNAWRDIRGAREALGTGDAVVCLGAGRKEGKITCKIRAAWAGLSGVRQECFQASCHVPETSCTLMSYYQVCMKCLWGYLVCCGVPGCRCLMHLGGSGGQSEISDLEGRFGTKQINFEQKSVVMT